MPKSAWIEVFKEGQHTSSSGMTREYTAEDLDTMVTLYNGQTEHLAPLVIGHPKTDDPAYGWVKELKHVRGKLMAFVDQVRDEVVDAVNEGAYKKVSIALYPNFMLRHVGLLGAQPPAVKGLTAVAFSESDTFEEYIWVSDEWRIPVVGRVLRGLRDFIIEKFGLDTADKVLPNWDLDTLTEPVSSTMLTLPTPTPPILPPASIQVPPVGAITSTYGDTNKEEIDMTKEEVQAIVTESLQGVMTKFGEDLEAKLESRFADSDKKINELSTSIQTSKELSAEEQKAKVMASDTAQFNEFLDKMVADGKVLPAEIDILKEEFAEMRALEDTLTFEEGKVRPTAKMRSRLEARPVLVARTGNFATKQKANDQKLDVPAAFAEFQDKVQPASLDIHESILKLADEKKITYEEAAVIYSQA